MNGFGVKVGECILRPSLSVESTTRINSRRAVLFLVCIKALLS